MRRTSRRCRDRATGPLTRPSSGWTAPSAPSWNTSLTSTPRATRSARAASMSETTRYSPLAGPGAADATFVPNMIEHPEPGGVNCTTRKSSSAAKSASSRQPRAPRRTPWPGRRRSRTGRLLELEVHGAGRRVVGLSLHIGAAHPDLHSAGPSDLRHRRTIRTTRWKRKYRARPSKCVRPGARCANNSLNSGDMWSRSAQPQATG